MYCMNCGKRLGKVGENADVCPFCGARLPAASPGAAALFAVFAGIDAAVLRLLLPHQK